MKQEGLMFKTSLPCKDDGKQNEPSKGNENDLKVKNILYTLQTPQLHNKSKEK